MARALETISRAEVLSRRLAAELLSVPGPKTAAEVVAQLTCVQSQEWAHGFWSLGMRTAGLSCADVRSEFDRGAFVRTHVLRPTWHFVPPADLGWLLALTSPRVQRRNAPYYERQGLDAALLERAAAVMVDAVAGEPMTRAELGRVLARSGIETDGMRLANLVLWAELEGRLVSGPIRGAQHTYVTYAARIPAATAITPVDPLTELARRFLRGRGPSTPTELARWASLTLSDAREAFERLGCEVVSAAVSDAPDQTVWWLVEQSDASAVGRVWWLPLYDEATLSHTGVGFAPLAGHPQSPAEDRFVGYVVSGADDLGRWRRTVRGSRVELQLELAPGVPAPLATAARAEGERLARFLGKAPVW